MGVYSAHWTAYARASRKGLVQLGLLLVLGLPGTALPAYGVSLATGEYPVLLHLGLLAAWLVAFTWLALRHSRVDCPRCGMRYSRGRGLCNCPRCGLRMLQEDP